MAGAGEDGVIAAGTGEHDREADGGDHEEHRRPGSELGEEGGCTARAESCLRALSAEGTCEVCGASLLQENDAHDKERDEDVDDENEIEHRGSFATFLSQNVWIGAEEGT